MVSLCTQHRLDRHCVHKLSRVECEHRKEAHPPVYTKRGPPVVYTIFNRRPVLPFVYTKEGT